MNCARKNTPQNSEATAKKAAALPAENARARKKRIGSIGARARSSQATNAATSSAPPAQRADHLGAAPAGQVAAHEPPDEPEDADA